MGAARSERGLVLVAVNYRETAATIRRFIEALGMTVPVLLDDTGHAARAWTPRIFPTTVLIDRRGRPAGMIVGELDWESPPALQRIGPLLESA
jgi:peroxiredoxin